MSPSGTDRSPFAQISQSGHGSSGWGEAPLGLEQAGFEHLVLNELYTTPCDTLRLNRPEWKVAEGTSSTSTDTPMRARTS